MSKLTPELQNNILQLLKLGVPQKYACEAVGIDETTFCRWIKIGRHKTEGKYYEFYQSVLRSNSEAMAIKLANLEKAAQKGSVNAITWFLEHKYPEEFGNKIKVEHSGNNNQPVQIVFTRNNGTTSVPTTTRNRTTTTTEP